jgi:hypothetical protein
MMQIIFLMAGIIEHLDSDFSDHEKWIEKDQRVKTGRLQLLNTTRMRLHEMWLYAGQRQAFYKSFSRGLR